MLKVLRSKLKFNFQACLFISGFLYPRSFHFNFWIVNLKATIFCGLAMNVFHFFSMGKWKTIFRESISNPTNFLFFLKLYKGKYKSKTDVLTTHVQCACWEASNGRICTKLKQLHLMKAGNQWQMTSRADLQWQLFISSLRGFYLFTPPSLWR